MRRCCHRPSRGWRAQRTSSRSPGHHCACAKLQRPLSRPITDQLRPLQRQAPRGGPRVTCSASLTTWPGRLSRERGSRCAASPPPIEARGLAAGMTDSQKGSLPRQPGCRLRRRSRAELTDLGRDRRPGVLPVVPDDPVADRRVSVLTLSLQRPGSLESCEICRLAAHPRGAPPGHRLRMWNAIPAISRLDATEMASMPRRGWPPADQRPAADQNQLPARGGGKTWPPRTPRPGPGRGPPPMLPGPAPGPAQYAAVSGLTTVTAVSAA